MATPSDNIITSYLPATTIDAVADFMLIQQNSSNSYKSINRNVLLGVTGQPADTSTVQTFTNKVIGNSNTATLKDTLFTLQDDGDATKQAQFQLSGITTATTRTYTLPNASSTLVDLVTTQSLTNKTLTAPTITGGTIDNSTITVDSIAGHTSASTSSIAGLSITSGVITTANSVGSTALQTNAVQANQLATNAITLGYSQITSISTVNASTFTNFSTNLTNSFTVPAGGRRVKITFGASGVFINATNSAYCIGFNLDGTIVQQIVRQEETSGYQFPPTMIYSAVLTSGAHTVTVQGNSNSVGTITINASTGSSTFAGFGPAFILVEAI